MSGPLRIGFDMDGVLADFASAYRAVEMRLFGAEPPTAPDPPEAREASDDGAEAMEGDRVSDSAGPAASDEVGHGAEEGVGEAQAAGAPVDPKLARAALREARRRQNLVWREIRQTPNFWTTLAPLEEGTVARLHGAMLRHGWEVFFITQRPRTEGETVQRQTQRWLVAQGFDLPSVLVLGGSRGRAAGALRLDYHVDDSPQNCIDVLTDSSAKPLLIIPDDDPVAVASARKLRIRVTSSISSALDILDEAGTAATQPSIAQRLATLLDWRQP